MSALRPYAKSLVLLLLIILAAVAQALGLVLNLDIEHFVGLLVADFLVWLVPNEETE